MSIWNHVSLSKLDHFKRRRCNISLQGCSNVRPRKTIIWEMSITNQQFPLKNRHDTTFHRAWEYTPEITIMIQKSPIKLEWYHLFGPYLQIRWWPKGCDKRKYCLSEQWLGLVGAHKSTVMLTSHNSLYKVLAMEVMAVLGHHSLSDGMEIQTAI